MRRTNTDARHWRWSSDSRRWVGTALLLATVSVPFFGGRGSLSCPNAAFAKTTESPVVFQPFDKERLQIEIAAILRETEGRNREAYERASQEIRRTEHFFDRAQAGIAPTVDELSSLLWLANHGVLQLKDGITGKNEAGAAITGLLERGILGEVALAARGVENALSLLNETLASNHRDMGVRMAFLVNSLSAPGDSAKRDASKAFLDDVLQGLKTLSPIPAIPSTCRAISADRVESVYRRACGRKAWPLMTGSGKKPPYPYLVASANGSGAVLVPFFWCPNENCIRKELLSELTEALARCRKEAMDLGKRYADERLEAYHEHNASTARDLVDRLT